MPTSGARGTDTSADNPGSQTALRGRNVRRVVETLIAQGSSTQADLARRTGLSKATVSSIVQALASGGLVATSPTTSSGRRAVMVHLEGRGAVAAGIDFGRRHVRVVLASLGREVVAEREIPLPLGHRGEVGIEAAAEVLDALLAETGIERRAVLGVGAGIPGPIDRLTGTIVEGEILPEWIGLNVLQALEERLQLPVFIDNDANLGALAQVTWGPHTGVENIVFLKIGTGIGCGLIIRGAPYYGHAGTAGEIGHTPVTDSGPLCRCGNRGCLELVASTSMLIDALGHGRDVPVTTDEIVRNALAGDAVTLRVIDDAGFAAGRALAGVANLVNPEVIVVGGPLAGLGEILLGPIRRGLLRFAMPLAGQRTTVAVSSLGDRAEALGAAALVIRQVDLPAALAII